MVDGLGHAWKPFTDNTISCCLPQRGLTHIRLLLQLQLQLLLLLLLLLLVLAPRPPGFLDTLASLLLCVSMLIREDLPTFERPITANSGCDWGGHPFRSTLLLTYTAFFTLAKSDAGSVSCCV